MIDMPAAPMFKQVIDCVGYSVMGLVGLFGAWQRMRVASVVGLNAQSEPGGVPRRVKQPPPLQRIEKVERDLQQLRKRQDEMQTISVSHHNEILRQQTAILDLLVLQRSLLDRIVIKAGGLS